jgi:shikimate 5-dehydrogenase
MRVKHKLSQQLLKRRAVQILVVGAGGTGSAVLMGLHRPSHDETGRNDATRGIRQADM